jgi:hypothetical protein
MKKAKVYTHDELFIYVKNQIEKYPEKNNVRFYHDIADIFGRTNKKYGISYLEEKINPPESDLRKDIDYLPSMIMLSDWYKDKEKSSELTNRIFILFSRNAKALDFKNLTLSLTTIISFMQRKEEYSDQAKIDLIDEHIKEFYWNHDYNTVKKIADLYKIVGIKYGIKYLEGMMHKTDDDFNLILQISDYYFKNKDFENAFREVARASLLINIPIEQGDYFSKLIMINDRRAEICIKEKEPNCDFYLVYSLTSFALNIARDLISFPHLSGFYYRKSSNYSPYCDSGFDNPDIINDADDDMDISFKKLRIFKYRKTIIKELCIPSSFKVRLALRSEPSTSIMISYFSC